MYEHLTYESILSRMLDRVPDTLDKREGSIIYDALAPAAAELQLAYIEADLILNETFADTASRPYLIKRAAERGVVPRPETNAILKGRFNIPVPIGARFYLDDLNYIVTEKMTDYDYKLKCEVAGEKGNYHLGNLTAIDFVEGLEKAELLELLVPGENEEETEALRERYFSSLDSQAFGGNVTDYLEKTNKLSGVGGVKVYPVWNGGGTVKLVIIDSTFKVPSQTLISAVQTAVDPIENHGLGKGFAPIGHTVSVFGVEATMVDISTEITYESGWNWASVEKYAYEIIDNYFKELAISWERENNLIVRISQLETRLLNVKGIVDIANTSVNGKMSNLVLELNKIPVRGKFNG